MRQLGGDCVSCVQRGPVGVPLGLALGSVEIVPRFPSPFSRIAKVSDVMNATASETEPQLIARAQQAVSQCNWDVGECASLWTKRFAKGRTDNDFAQLVGLSADQVYQRRRVWESFSDVREHYSGLKWSHFYSALTWDDAAECLQWAQDTGATVAEMRAWRRAMRGEDLSVAAEDDPLSWIPHDPAEVRVPQEDRGEAGDSTGNGQQREREAAVPVASGVARESTGSGDDYAPFRPDAATAPPTEASERPRPAPSIEQQVRRLTTTMERCAAAINADFMSGFADVAEKEQRRFLAAARTLADKLEAIG